VLADGDHRWITTVRFTAAAPRFRAEWP